MLKLTQSATKRKFYLRYSQIKFHFFLSHFCRVKLHQYKIVSHTQKSITAFLEKLIIDISIECISFQQIPKKISSLDYCAFGPLKRGFSKRKNNTIDGLWKDVEEDWRAIPVEVSQELFYHGNHDEDS